MSSRNDPQVVETWRMNADFLINDLESILTKLRNIDNAIGLIGRHHMRLEFASNALTDLAAPHHRSAAE